MVDGLLKAERVGLALLLLIYYTYLYMYELMDKFDLKYRISYRVASRQPITSGLQAWGSCNAETWQRWSWSIAGGGESDNLGWVFLVGSPCESMSCGYSNHKPSQSPFLWAVTHQTGFWKLQSERLSSRSKELENIDRNTKHDAKLMLMGEHLCSV